METMSSGWHDCDPVEQLVEITGNKSSDLYASFSKEGFCEIWKPSNPIIILKKHQNSRKKTAEIGAKTRTTFLELQGPDIVWTHTKSRYNYEFQYIFLTDIFKKQKLSTLIKFTSASPRLITFYFRNAKVITNELTCKW